MNDFERRLLDIAQDSSYIASIARQDQKIIAIDSFAYNVQIAGIASGAAGQGFIQIQSDSDFVLTYMSAVQTVNNVLGLVPNTTVQITDTGSGKTFFNQATLLPNVFGILGYPFILPAPRVISPNTNLKVDVNNVFSAAAATYDFCFWGARVYYAQ